MFYLHYSVSKLEKVVLSSRSALAQLTSSACWRTGDRMTRMNWSVNLTCAASFLTLYATESVVRVSTHRPYKSCVRWTQYGVVTVSRRDRLALSKAWQLQMSKSIWWKLAAFTSGDCVETYTAAAYYMVLISLASWAIVVLVKLPSRTAGGQTSCHGAVLPGYRQSYRHSKKYESATYTH